MADITTLWEILATARHELVRAAVGGMAPPRHGLQGLEAWQEETPTLPEMTVSAGRMAQAWGQLQLIMIACGPATPEGEHAAAWRRVRRAAEEGLLALLLRPEWSSLHADFREEVLSRLAEAVSLTREGRVARCSAAVQGLRALAARTSGQPHAWRIHCVAEMQYPWMTSAGWFARMAIDFTWRRARAVTRAVCEEVCRQRAPSPLSLVVGYDSRLHAEELAVLVAEVAGDCGIPVHLCQHAAPVPALLDYLRDTLGGAHSCGLLHCTGSHLPVQDPGARSYSGHAYEGLRFYLPSGELASPDVAERISRRAMELLLDAPVSRAGDEFGRDAAATGEVTMFTPADAYRQHVIAAMGYPVVLPDGEEEPARTLVKRYWGTRDALIVIDDMYGAARGYLAALCAELDLPHAVLHGDGNPLYGELGAANPQPPYLADLIARVKEHRGERQPLIGLACDADGDRLGVVDETGAFLPGNAVLALLTDYLLQEGYAGEPGVVLRDRTATRLLDRLAQCTAYAGRTLAPPYREHLPPYMHAADYLRLTGDPRALHGYGIEIAAGRWWDLPPHLLIAGDARGGMLLPGAPGMDALRAGLLLLQLCAVRGKPPQALWQELQQRLGPSASERLELYAPDDARRALINRAIDHYQGAIVSQLASMDYLLAGCTVRYAGGVRDQFVEWALHDAHEQPAYLTVTQLYPEAAIRVEAEAADAHTAHRLLISIATRMEALIGEQLHRAENPWKVVELLATVTSPLALAAELPGTLTCRLAGEAYSRLQELARPGRDAPELLRFVTDRLGERQPENARVLAACHLETKPVRKKTPPTPRVRWESDGEG
jgi:phosphomannomutase